MTIGEVINKTFGHVYVKNLSESVERRKLIQESFDRVGLKYSIETAYDGLKFVSSNFSFQHGPFHIKYPSSAGFFGGQLTTIRILMDEIEKQSPFHIMCDDDSFVRDISSLDSKQINTIASNLPSDWDIVILGSLNYDGKLNDTTEFSYVKCTHGWEAAGSHAVAINAKAYNWFFSKNIQFRFWGDGCIDSVIQDGMNVYMLTPSLIFQDRNCISTINKTKPTDYLIPRTV